MIVTVEYQAKGILDEIVRNATIYHIVAEDKHDFLEQLCTTIVPYVESGMRVFSHALVVYTDDNEHRRTFVTQRFDSVEQVLNLYQGDNVTITYGDRAVKQSNPGGSRNSPINIDIARTQRLAVELDQRLKKRINRIHTLFHAEEYDFSTLPGFYARLLKKEIPRDILVADKQSPGIFPWFNDSDSSVEYTLDDRLYLVGNKVVGFDYNSLIDKPEAINRTIEKYGLYFPFEWIECNNYLIPINFESMLNQYWQGYRRFQHSYPRNVNDELIVHITGPISQFYRSIKSHEAQQDPPLFISYKSRTKQNRTAWEKDESDNVVTPPDFPDQEFIELWKQDHQARIRLAEDPNYQAKTIINPLHQIDRFSEGRDDTEIIASPYSSLFGQEEVDDLPIQLLRPGIIIAGSYAMAYAGYGLSPIDVDLFFYRTDDYSFEDQLAYVLAMLDDLTITHETSHAISINARMHSLHTNIQVIKRLYDSPQQVIYGFDLPVSSWLIRLVDGEVVLEATPLGLWCSQRALIVFDVHNASTSYYSRLKKYVFTKGFDLWLPGLRAEDIRRKSELTALLEYYKIPLNSVSFKWHNRTVVYIKVLTARETISDYSFGKHRVVTLDRNNQVIAVGYPNVFGPLLDRLGIDRPSMNVITNQPQSQGYYDRHTNSFHPVKMSWREYYYDGVNQAQLPAKRAWLVDKLNERLGICGIDGISFVRPIPTLLQLALERVDIGDYVKA